MLARKGLNNFYVKPELKIKIVVVNMFISVICNNIKNNFF